MSNDLAVQPAIVIFDKGRAEACGVAPVGVADPTFFAPITKAQREAGGVRALATNDAGEMVAPDGTVGGVPVSAEVNPDTGGVEVPFVVKGKSAAALAATPSADDIALGDSTLFYNIADPTKRYTMNSARSAFVLVADGHVEPYILSQSSVPVILLPSGAVNASGQFTLTTALPYVPPGTVKVYVFAGVGLAAGLYSATFTSATVCQIVGNPSTIAGVYAGGTGRVTLASLTIPGGSMGANGSVRHSCLFQVINNANGKSLFGRFADAAFSGFNTTVSTLLMASAVGFIRNRNSQSRQICAHNVSEPGTGTTPPSYTTIDTSLDQTLAYQASLTVATDYVILEGYAVEILPGA